MDNNSPNFVEKIICLANSRKITGRCVAGKRIHDQSWCRPISARPGHEISEIDRRYPNGKMARLLDIIEIPCIKKMPKEHQNENVLIDDRFCWEKKGHVSWQEILTLVDQDAELWINGFHAYYNRNNRVPETLIDQGGGSLRLIHVDKIVLSVEPKAPEFGNMKPIVRAGFIYQGYEYRLDMTDPEYETICLGKGVGEYSIAPVIVCVSLSELHTNRNGGTFAYKLVTSIVTRGKAGI
jgi:hypothetical protein